MTDIASNNKPDDAESNMPRSNVPEFSVSELAFSLKRTLEDTYGRVRVRGELSRISIPRSGHLYTAIKDDQATIDAVCWKGVHTQFSIKPEEGMEVICIGRISTYPARSNYQLIIESMELAGEGALLKMLEERKKKLTAEGLFAQERKKQRPFLPKKIGVVTSPTGAVIRDILHRLADRFPRDVLVWPVLVQGDGAAEQVSNAIRGFNTMDESDKPDLLIVARGGGSLEDLMPFNEENVVRAIADSGIPIISAIGHETDTTLADFAADLRAPTPTGAAELAVPVRHDLRAGLMELEQRLFDGWHRSYKDNAARLETLTAKLGDPSKMLETQIQRFDFSSEKLSQSYTSYLQKLEYKTSEIASRLTHPKHQIEHAQQKLQGKAEQLMRLAPRLTDHLENKLESLSRLLETLSFKSTLERGFVVVRDGKDTVITNHDDAKGAQSLELEFAGDKRLNVSIGDYKKPAPKKAKPKNSDSQESLF